MCAFVYVEKNNIVQTNVNNISITAKVEIKERNEIDNLKYVKTDTVWREFMLKRETHFVNFKSSKNIALLPKQRVD